MTRKINKDIIPKGDYCYSGSRGLGNKGYKACPFWRIHYISASSSDKKHKYTQRSKEDNFKSKQIIEADKYPLYNSNCDAKFPHYQIGECTLLHISDLDQIGFGLLWDQCKECGINTE